jgi:hypothetical protein
MKVEMSMEQYERFKEQAALATRYKNLLVDILSTVNVRNIIYQEGFMPRYDKTVYIKDKIKLDKIICKIDEEIV